MVRMPRSLLIGMPIWGIDFPPLSLAYVCSIIKEAGWECKMVDMNIYLYNFASEKDKTEWDNTLFYLHDEKYQSCFFGKFRDQIQKKFLELTQKDTYHLIGFSVTQQSRYFSIQAAKLFSSLKPEIPILFGGSDCFPMEYGRNFFTDSDYSPDIIFQGEAEIGLIKFLKEFEKNRSYKTTVQGFAFKEDKKIVDNGAPELPSLKDNDIIADYSQFDFGIYNQPVISSFFSRGCVNKCAFCNERFHFKRFRNRKLETVLKEIQNSIKYALKFTDYPGVSFVDSVFNGNPKVVDRLCDLIIESGLKIFWSASVSFSRIMKRMQLEKMYKAGCRFFFWGLESASQNVLNLMGKNFTINEAKKVLSDTIELGINNHLAIITGFPGETPEDVVTTAMFILEYRKKEFVTFPYVTPVEIKVNSLLHSNYMDYGIKSTDRYNWISKDGRNDRSVRVFRFFVIHNVIFNDELSFQTCTQLKVCENDLDFNSPPLASEIASILYNFGVKDKQENKTRNFLENWSGKTIFNFSQEEIDYWYPERMPKGLHLNEWFNRDKNSVNLKKKIIEFLMESIKNVARMEVI